MEPSAFLVEQQCLVALVLTVFPARPRRKKLRGDMGERQDIPAVLPSTVGFTDATGVATNFSPQSSPSTWALEQVLYTPKALVPPVAVCLVRRVLLTCAFACALMEE